MKIKFFTIVLDGMPFLPMQLACFHRLADFINWEWIVIEGAAGNTGSTRWCQPQAPRLSNDGSTEFLNGLKDHPRVRILQNERWDGKDQMCNAALAEITEPCLLVEIDVDELWTPQQLQSLFIMGQAEASWNAARFLCRYFVGPNIVTVGTNCYGNNPGEWLRVWKFKPGMRFQSHEPPIMTGHSNSRCLGTEYTSAANLIFHHWAYVFPKQVEYKEQFYGYKDALAHWKRLQDNNKWPARLKDFFHWADDRAMVDLFYK